MRNYRVTFLKDVKVNYWNKAAQAEAWPNFREFHLRYYPIVKAIREAAKEIGIKHIWNFYEPYCEVTWLSGKKQAKQLIKKIKGILALYSIKDAEFIMPKAGQYFAEWYAASQTEKEFGAKRYALCAELVALFHEYDSPIRFGMGAEAQVNRTIHGICNQMGLNYMDEAKICFSRGLICVLFKYFSFKTACWIYRNIFRLKY